MSWNYGGVKINYERLEYFDHRRRSYDEVVAVDNGQKGIAASETALSQQKPFDLVITDFGMPQMNGDQVAKTVKVLSPSTPVILLPGWDSQWTADGETLAAIDFFLNKPLTSRDLKFVIGRVISQCIKAKP